MGRVWMDSVFPLYRLRITRSRSAMNRLLTGLLARILRLRFRINPDQVALPQHAINAINLLGSQLRFPLERGSDWILKNPVIAAFAPGQATMFRGESTGIDKMLGLPRPTKLAKREQLLDLAVRLKANILISDAHTTLILRIFGGDFIEQHPNPRHSFNGMKLPEVLESQATIESSGRTQEILHDPIILSRLHRGKELLLRLAPEDGSDVAARVAQNSDRAAVFDNLQNSC